MKKTLLLCLLCVMSIFTLKAQEMSINNDKTAVDIGWDRRNYPTHAGSVTFGYGIGLDKYAGFSNLDRIYLEMVQGIQIDPYIFCGVGAGFSYFYGIEKSSEKDVVAAMIPVFMQVKPCFPLNERNSMALSVVMNIGGDIGVGNLKKQCGLMAGFGQEFRYNQFTMGIQFRSHKISNEILISVGGCF